MALQGPQLDSLGSSVSTTTGVSQSVAVSPGQSSQPSKTGSLAPTGSATPAVPTEGASTRGQETLKMTKEALSGEKIIGRMDNVSQANVMGDIAAKMGENVNTTLKEVGESDTGKALQGVGSGIGVVGLGVGIATSETVVGAIVGGIIAAVGAAVGGIGTMMQNAAKSFGKKVAPLLQGQVKDFVEITQKEKGGEVIDLALGEEEVVADASNATGNIPASGSIDEVNNVVV